MALAFLDWLVILVFMLLFLGVGLYYGRHSGSGISSFFLGGRNLPWYIAGLSMVATTFAADTPLAVAELVAFEGISKNWLWWSFLTGGLFTSFFFAQLWRRAEILTELEFIQFRYSGKQAKFLRLFKAVYLGFFMNTLIIAWVNLAMLTLITIFFDISVNKALAVVAFLMLLSFLYSAKSGLKGIAIADAVQFSIAMIGCFILAYLVVSSNEIGGIQGLKQKLPNSYFEYFPSLSSSNNLSNFTLALGAFLAFIGVQWWASWYPGQEPGGGGYVAQRMMSAKDEKSALFATLFFQVAHYCIRPWPWIIVGLCAVALYNPNFSTDGNNLLNAAYMENPRLGFVYIMRDFLPIGLKGLLLVAFIAAYMSTISTQLNWGSSYLVNDFWQQLKPQSELKQVTTARVFTLVIAIAGVFVTTLIESISGVWEFILECGAGLGLVLILRWFWWRINAWSEITATIAPFVGYMIGHWYLAPNFGESFTEHKGPYLFTVAFTSICWLLVTYLTKPDSDAVLSNFYQKIKPAGFWGKWQTKNAESIVKHQFIAWITAVISVYALLFFIGDVIFQNLERAAILLLLVVVFGIIMRKAILKISR